MTSAEPEKTQAAEVVNLTYEDLLSSKDLTVDIEKAYGLDGLGILTVSNIPGLVELRQRILTSGYQFANLPEEIKAKYEDKKSHYSVGWSHGKEIFNGKPDVLKGSYYNNPQYDKPTEDNTVIEKFPFYAAPNLWPASGEAPDFEKSFKEMGRLIVEVGTLVAKQCDSYVRKLYPNLKDGDNDSIHDLEKVIVESRNAKARMLYYFPLSKEQIQEQQGSNKPDSWCGWHLDHGSLTGLTNAMFIDTKTGKPIQPFTDEEAGLFIKTRKGVMVKAKWSADRLAFQIGESAQIHSGGKVIATPHCVRGTVIPNIARVTYVVFMQPNYDCLMSPPEGVDIKNCEIDVLEKDMPFHSFSQKRFEKYYGTQ